MSYVEKITYNAALSILSAFLVILAILLIIFYKKIKPQKPTETLPSTITSIIKSYACPYSLMDIDSATDSFNHRRIIGAGRLGTVYAAVRSNGEIVAVKRIHPRLVLSNVGFNFSSIIKSLSLAHHPNLVPILGFSEGPGERIIVMEFVGMMSLDFYLHRNTEGAPLLDWGSRLRIAAGVARAVEYLHEMMSPKVVHGNIKPSNILIDAKFCARVCDYGLSFFAPKERNGILGYVDDEYWVKGGSKESDIYSLGVVLLELLSGKKSEKEGLIVNWALPLIKEMKYDEFLDPRLVIPNDIKNLVRLGKVASACVGNSRKNRPSIAQIVSILNNLEDGAVYVSNVSL